MFLVTSHVYTAELDIDNLKFTLSSLIESLNGFVMCNVTIESFEIAVHSGMDGGGEMVRAL